MKFGVTKLVLEKIKKNDLTAILINQCRHGNEISTYFSLIWIFLCHEYFSPGSLVLLCAEFFKPQTIVESLVTYIMLQHVQIGNKTNKK